MDGKYIIILLFIFLVFLMGSINSTITNNFYNNTTGSQDHYNLTNLSFDDSGHTGFQSSDTLNDDIAGLGYVTNITGNFVNKSGDTMNIGSSGILRINDTQTSISGRVFETYHNNSLRTFITNAGLQYWYINYSNNYEGLIAYVNPNNVPGIAFLNSSNSGRADIRLGVEGIEFWSYFHNGTLSQATLRVNRTTQSLQILNLSGTGNRPLCADSTGNIIICP